MTSSEMDRLGQYNAEVARGLVHTEEWKTEMAKLQDQWNQMRAALTGGGGLFFAGPIHSKPWWQLW